MNTITPTKWLLTLAILASGSLALTTRAAEVEPAESAQENLGDAAPINIFDAIDQGIVDVKFIARSAEKGRLVMTNKTKEPVSVLVPDAFAGVPVLHQFGGGGGGRGGGGGGFGGGGGGGGQQSVGGGGGGMGGGGMGGGGGGMGGGAFNIAPEKIGRLDVPLLCLDHGLRDPSSSKPYEIRPIEDVVKSPALVEIVKAYAAGELPHGASQAAAWHINSGVPWQQLAAKLTGTVRTPVRNAYFSRSEIQNAMKIVARAETLTAGKEFQPRNWKSPSQKEAEAEEETSSDKSNEEGYEEKSPAKVLDLDASLTEVK